MYRHDQRPIVDRTKFDNSPTESDSDLFSPYKTQLTSWPHSRNSVKDRHKAKGPARDLSRSVDLSDHLIESSPRSSQPSESSSAASSPAHLSKVTSRETGEGSSSPKDLSSDPGQATRLDLNPLAPKFLPRHRRESTETVNSTDSVNIVPLAFMVGLCEPDQGSPSKKYLPTELAKALPSVLNPSAPAFEPVPKSAEQPRKEESPEQLTKHKARSAERRRKKEETRCTSCGEYGHLLDQCRSLDISWYVQPVSMPDEKCTVEGCGKFGHRSETCWVAHPGLKELSRCPGCGKFGHGLDACWTLHPEMKCTVEGCGQFGHRSDVCWLTHPELKALLKCRGCGKIGHCRETCRMREKCTVEGCGKFGHRPDTCWVAHPERKPKPRCLGCGIVGHLLNECWVVHPRLKKDKNGDERQSQAHPTETSNVASVDNREPGREEVSGDGQTQD